MPPSQPPSSPPGSPPSPPPPLTPGLTYLPVVTAALTLETSLAEFDSSAQAAFKDALAAKLGVQASAITLSIAAGSVVVTAEILAPDDATAASAVATLEDTSPAALATLSADLGMTVGSIAAVGTSSVPYRTSPPSPPSPSPPPPLPPAPLSPNATNLTDASMGCVDPFAGDAWDGGWQIALAFFSGLLLGLLFLVIDRCVLRPPPYANGTVPPTAANFYSTHGAAVGGGGKGSHVMANGRVVVSSGWGHVPSPGGVGAPSPIRRAQPGAGGGGGGSLFASPWRADAPQQPPPSPGFTHSAAWASPQCAAAMLRPDQAPYAAPFDTQSYSNAQFSNPQVVSAMLANISERSERQSPEGGGALESSASHEQVDALAEVAEAWGKYTSKSAPRSAGSVPPMRSTTSPMRDISRV